MEKGLVSNGYNDKTWHLDKRLPIGIIMAILLQTAILGSFLGSLESRVTAIEGSRFTAAQGAALRADVDHNREDLIALEARTIKSLDEIRYLLERIREKLEEHDTNGASE